MGRILKCLMRLLAAFGIGLLLMVAVLVAIYVVGFDDARQSDDPSWTSDGQLTIVALGDSYMSGEGAEEFLVDTDGPDNKCRRAAHAYPFLIAKELRAQLTTAACSGAEVENIASVAVPGVITPVPQANAEGRQQIEALKEHPEADLVLLSVGGNDAKFAQIIQNCMGFRKHCSDVGGYWLENLRQVTMPRLEILLAEIRGLAPQARILVMTYPEPFAVAQLDCSEIGLSQDEIGFIGKFVSTLKLHIDKAAVEAGAEPIDMVSAFDGYGLCSGTATPAINGWDPQKPSSLTWDPVDVLRGSFHPTAFGHELMAQRILDHLEKFPLRSDGELPPRPPLPTGDDPVEEGTPWSSTPPNDCTPYVVGKTDVANNDQSFGLVGASPGSRVCYRIGNDPFTVGTTGDDGSLDIEFPRPPVHGESGLRQVIHQQSDGEWWLLQMHATIGAPPQPLPDPISAWLGGSTQLCFAIVGALVIATTIGAILLWLARRLRNGAAST